MWGNLADNLWTLAEWAFPELDKRAKQKLSVDHFLSLLNRPEVTVAVCQKKPKCLDDTVAATLEIESILSLNSSHAGIQIGKLSTTEEDQQQQQTSAMTELLSH